jgi:hypothetical protein
MNNFQSLTTNDFYTVLISSKYQFKSTVALLVTIRYITEITAAPIMIILNALNSDESIRTRGPFHVIYNTFKHYSSLPHRNWPSPTLQSEWTEIWSESMSTSKTVPCSATERRFWIYRLWVTINALTLVHRGSKGRDSMRWTRSGSRSSGRLRRSQCSSTWTLHQSHLVQRTCSVATIGNSYWHQWVWRICRTIDQFAKYQRTPS